VGVIKTKGEKMNKYIPNYLKYERWEDGDDVSFKILKIKCNDKKLQEHTFPETTRCFDIEDQPISETIYNYYQIIVGGIYNEGYMWCILRLLAMSSGCRACDLIQGYDKESNWIYTKTYVSE